SSYHTVPILRSTCACFFSLIPPPPRSTLFPYTTLFRSSEQEPLKLVATGRDQDFGLRLGLDPLGRDGQADCPPEADDRRNDLPRDRKSTRLNSSHVAISYAVFCLKKKIKR